MFKSLKKLGLAGASAIAYAFLLSAAPPGEKRIEVERQSRTDAVVVTKVVLGSAEVESGLYVSSGRVQPVTPVEASDDWLRNVTIHVYNQTDKTIAFGQVTLAFPETGDGSYQSPLRVYNITLGRIPSSVAFSGRTGKAIAQNPSSGAISFAPHELHRPPGYLLLRRWDEMGSFGILDSGPGQTRYIQPHGKGVLPRRQTPRLAARLR